MKKKNLSRTIGLALSILLLLQLFVPCSVQAATVRLNKKTLTLEVGNSAKLRVQGTERTVTWKSKNPKVATVTTAGKVTAQGTGNTVIYAKAGKYQYSCQVTVLPEFQIDEKALTGELDGRLLEVDGQSFRVQEEEIGGVEILSQVRSKSNQYIRVTAKVELDRTIALMQSTVNLYYKNTGKRWKLSKVTTETEVEEWNLEGTWNGSVKVYDYSRNSSDYRDMKLEIYDVKDDGLFDAVATLEGAETDSVELAGKLNEETGELELSGLNWIEDSSELAKSLSKKGKVYSFYAVPDFLNDTFVSNNEISTRVTFTKDLILEKDMDGREEKEEEDSWIEEDFDLGFDMEEESKSEEEEGEDSLEYEYEGENEEEKENQEELFDTEEEDNEEGMDYEY